MTPRLALAGLLCLGAAGCSSLPQSWGPPSVQGKLTPFERPQSAISLSARRRIFYGKRVSLNEKSAFVGNKSLPLEALPHYLGASGAPEQATEFEGILAGVTLGTNRQVNPGALSLLPLGLGNPWATGMRLSAGISFKDLLEPELPLIAFNRRLALGLGLKIQDEPCELEFQGLLPLPLWGSDALLPGEKFDVVASDYLVRRGDHQWNAGGIGMNDLQLADYMERNGDPTDARRMRPGGAAKLCRMLLGGGAAGFVLGGLGYLYVGLVNSETHNQGDLLPPLGAIALGGAGMMVIGDLMLNLATPSAENQLAAAADFNRYVEATLRSRFSEKTKP
jgi:hypothetical protein